MQAGLNCSALELLRLEYLMQATQPRALCVQVGVVVWGFGPEGPNGKQKNDG